MWIFASFDIASDRSLEYRRFRKILLENGFLFFQKSLSRRWVENDEKADALCRRIGKAAACGDVFLMKIPDTAFARSFYWLNGIPQKIPDPPEPWTIL